MTTTTDSKSHAASFCVNAGYAPRSTSLDCVREHENWRLKLYDIDKDGGAIDAAAFEPGIELALKDLPTPAVTDERPGVGVIIRHQTPTLLYLILCWWGRVNEMPIRTFGNELGEGADIRGRGWRAAQGDESVCVWDLDVIAHERNAYVDHVLSRPDAPDLEAYLADAI